METGTTIMIRITPEAIERFLTRDVDCNRLSLDLGDPDKDGIYTPTVTVHHEDNPLSELKALVGELGYPPLRPIVCATAIVMERRFGEFDRSKRLASDESAHFYVERMLHNARKAKKLIERAGGEPVASLVDTANYAALARACVVKNRTETLEELMMSPDKARKEDLWKAMSS